MRGYSYDAIHKFITEVSNNIILIYVAKAGRHKNVAKRFKTQGQKVGGGSCYISNQLVLDDYSVDYGSILKEVAQIFAELIKPELEKLKINTEGCTNPHQHLNKFWKSKGFRSW